MKGQYPDIFCWKNGAPFEAAVLMNRHAQHKYVSNRPDGNCSIEIGSWEERYIDGEKIGL